MKKIVYVIIIILLGLYVLRGAVNARQDPFIDPVREISDCVHGDSIPLDVCDKFEEPVVEPQPIEAPKVLPATGDAPIIGK